MSLENESTAIPAPVKKKYIIQSNYDSEIIISNQKLGFGVKATGDPSIVELTDEQYNYLRTAQESNIKVVECGTEDPIDVKAFKARAKAVVSGMSSITDKMKGRKAGDQDETEVKNETSDQNTGNGDKSPEPPITKKSITEKPREAIRLINLMTEIPTVSAYVDGESRVTVSEAARARIQVLSNPPAPKDEVKTA